MEIYQGIILGIVQGLTEFLPVSSSGHLVLGQTLFGMTEAQLVFDISVHVGTLAAVLVVYVKDIAAMLSAVGRFFSHLFTRKPVRPLFSRDRYLVLAVMILIGSVPTAVIGLVLKEFEHFLFSSTVLVGFMLILTGTVLWLSRRYYRMDAQTSRPVTVRQALGVGVIQGLAVIPGISRSGSTIAAGMFMGLDRTTAARFSFLLSIPAIVGAELLGIKEMVETGASMDIATIWATLAAFVTGLGALIVLIRLVHSGRFHLFAPYCWLIGVIVLLSNIV